MVLSPKSCGTAFWSIADIPRKGEEIRALGASQMSLEELHAVLQTPSIVPFPCEIRFDSDLLLPGEFAHTHARGPQPEDGYTIFIHPVFAEQTEFVPHLLFQQLAFVLFGPATTPEEAEQFGAIALGLSRDQYYAVLCDLSMQTGGDELC